MSGASITPSLVATDTEVTAAIAAALALNKSMGSLNGSAASVALTTTPMFFLGSASSNYGFIPRRAGRMKRLYAAAHVSAAVTDGAVSVTATLRKNTNTGSTQRCFQVAATSLTAGAAKTWTATAVTDSGNDVFNGTTDYFTLEFAVTASTSCTLQQAQWCVEFEYDVA